MCHGCRPPSMLCDVRISNKGLNANKVTDASAVPVLDLRDEDDVEESATAAEPFTGRNARLELNDIVEEEGEKVR